MPPPTLASPRRRRNGGARALLSSPAEGVRRPSQGCLKVGLCALGVASWLTGCDTASTYVVLDNRYPESTTNPAVVYQAFWQAISFPTPLPPGSSSDPQSTIAASANLAYAVLAPGYDVTGDAGPPTSLVVLLSRTGFSVGLNQTLVIPVDDATFAGNCAAGSPLSQAEANFLTHIVFAGLFASVSYDAASCTSTPTADAGGS